MSELTVAWDAPGPGPWMQDRSHLPAAVTPLMQSAYPPGMQRGFAETLAAWGSLLDTMNVRFVNGFIYMQPLPFDAPGVDGPKSPEQLGAEIGRRTGVAAAAFEQRIWRESLERWDNELKPASIKRHRELADVDLSALDDEGLRDQLHQRIEWLTEMAYQHHRFNAMAMLPVGDFILHAMQWTGRPPVPMFAVFDGWSPVSGVVPPELAPAIDGVQDDPEAQALLHGDAPPAERLSHLRRRIPAVDEYLAGSGYRLAAGFDLTNPTIGERPDILLDRIRNSLDHDRDAAKRRSEQVADEIRADVPEEHRAEFDDLLAEARLVYRLRDERGLYSDAAAVGLLRLALIELGRRLFERGRINFMYDTLDLRGDEIDAILDGSAEPTADELSARVAHRKQSSAEGAPRLLGPPPPEPPPVDQLPPPLARVMSALGFYIDGVLGDVQTPIGDDNVVVGVGGSGGVYEGPARLVRNFDDLFNLQEGDVLVTTATGESFNAFLSLIGAAVTDHGSFASHAAIMGREMGFPAVVGTVDATSRIANGVMVRVDGDAGTVTIIGA
ncbi:MAG TPA: PEP-utilizing enzyme [Ilumatobacter sp.]|nr:PEP-utilizing enzyme [Ilumatobacter sp.]